MDIKNVSPNQNFGAKYIATTQIKEKVPFLPIYKKIDADFVELEGRSDVDSIKAYAKQKANSSHISLRFLENLQNKHPFSIHRAFAITLQQTQHKKLDAQKIIGICDGHYTCDWHDENIFFIDNLEAISKNNKHCNLNNRTISLMGFKFQTTDKMKHVGKALLKNVIKTVSKQVDLIQLETLKSSEGFYQRLGFKNDCRNPYCYRLSSKGFELLSDW